MEHVDGAPTAGRATSARNPLNFPVESVVDSQFLARSDLTQAYIKDVPLHDARCQIRLAGVIYIFSAGTTHRAVNGPVGIESKEIGKLPLNSAPLRLAAADLLARVFDYFASGWDELRCEDAPTMDFRPRQAHAETRLLAIDSRLLIL